MKKEDSCISCPWKHPETCKACKQDQDKEKLDLPDGIPKPDMTKYGLFYVRKISMD